jgi:hypothetical protein
MRQYGFQIIFFFYLVLVLSDSLIAQTWDFAKEKDGIKLYTRKDAGKTIKSYKGIAVIHAPAEKVFAMLEDVNHTEWWDKNVNQIKVLQYEKNKRALYYLVYDLPWPVTDRDLCVEAIVSIDPVTSIRKIIATPLPGLIPENKDMIRIKDYRQIWTVKPAGDESTYVELEGYADPTGSIPDWLANMLIVDSPYRVISGVKERMEKK